MVIPVGARFIAPFSSRLFFAPFHRALCRKSFRPFWFRAGEERRPFVRLEFILSLPKGRADNTSVIPAPEQESISFVNSPTAGLSRHTIATEFKKQTRSRTDPEGRS
jgi:hypothetical protein